MKCYTIQIVQIKFTLNYLKSRLVYHGYKFQLNSFVSDLKQERKRRKKTREIWSKTTTIMMTTTMMTTERIRPYQISQSRRKCLTLNLWQNFTKEPIKRHWNVQQKTQHFSLLACNESWAGVQIVRNMLWLKQAERC